MIWFGFLATIDGIRCQASDVKHRIFIYYMIFFTAMSLFTVVTNIQFRPGVSQHYLFSSSTDNDQHSGFRVGARFPQPVSNCAGLLSDKPVLLLPRSVQNYESQADQALYSAKAGGRNRIEAFSHLNAIFWIKVRYHI